MHRRSIISTLLVILIILISISPCLSDKNSIINKSSQPMTFSARGNIISANDTVTNVSVNKTIIGTSDKPRLVFEIITPEVDYFDFVLALDSSGSFGLGGNPDFGKAVAGAVLPFLEETKRKYPNKTFRVSIVSWDDDIDFALGNLANRNPSRANLLALVPFQSE